MSHADKELYEFADFRLDVEERLLLKNGARVQLPDKAFEMLCLLIKQNNHLVGKDELLEKVWAGAFVEENNLDKNISFLRHALGEQRGQAGQKFIETVRGRGYRFVVEARRVAADEAENDGRGAAKSNQDTVLPNVAAPPSPPRHRAVPQTGKVVALAQWRRGEADEKNSQSEKPDAPETIEEQSIVARVATPPEITPATQTNIVAGEKPIAENNVEKPAHKSEIRLALIAALSLVALAGIGFAVYKFANPAPPPNLKITRLTPDINVKAWEFTPDGKYVIYTLFEKGKQSVWMKDLLTGTPTQILPPTTDTGYGSVQFSRDGKLIYYSTQRTGKPNNTFVRVPLAGGTLEEIVSDVISPVAISPDEKRLAYIKSIDYWRLYIANIDGSGERVLAKRDLKKGWYESWDSRMSWSPDGSTVAIGGGRLGAGEKKISELILVNATDGSEQIIPTPNWNYLGNVQWLHDQTGLIVVARETETAPSQIWHVSYPDGATRRITNDTDDYIDIALSPDSRSLVANQHFQNLNIWLAPFDDTSKAKQLTFGNNASDGRFGVAFTPDGKIIYTSPRGGNVDLWQMNPDGGDQKQLTKNAGDWNIRPQVTLDGRYIVFVSTRTGAKQIWRMDADGGNPKQLTDVFSADHPNLSPDGEWIYLAMNEGDKPFIAKIPLNGGEPARVSKTPYHANSPMVSPDGKLIFYYIYEKGSAKPWRTALMSAETGEHLKTFDYFGINGDWGADSKSIINVGGTVTVNNLLQISLDEKEQKQLTNFESGRITKFAISPDRKQIAISRGHPYIEAILLENFR